MDKYINKFIDNPWFIRAVALILALLLFENVSEQNQSVVNVPQDQDAEVIENVPVKSYYDTENLVVTGLPETVTLTLTGPRSNLQQAKTQRGFEVFVDLTKAEIGRQRVTVQIKGVSERLKVTIDPETVEVSVQEKVSQEFSVDAEFNHGILAEGYISEAPVIEPNKVKITGAKDVVEKITYVKATLEADGQIKDTLIKEADILVLDKNLNKLDVLIEPNKVKVTIPIKASSKTVPIKLEQKGTLPDGVRIESVSLEKDEAQIIAPEETLKGIDSVRVELDVSNIREDTEVTLPVIIANEIIEVNPKVINVKVKISKAETRTISSIPINIEGLSEEFSAVLREPSNGLVSIEVTGSSEEISSLRGSDFKVYVDVSNLDVGEHEMDINVEGPGSIDWEISRRTVNIAITEKEA